MNTLLIFPPVSDPVHPPLGIAKLMGFLGKNKKNVKALDLNIAAYDYFFNNEVLKEAYNKVSYRINQLEKLEELNNNEIEEYKRLCYSYFDGEYLIDTAEATITYLRSPEIYNDWDKYSNAASIIYRVMKLVADSHYPALWDPRSLTFSKSQTNSSEVLNLINNEKENFFIQFFKKSISQIKEYSCEIIGISINYLCQLVPGLTLASILKEEIKGVKIVLGGSYFASYRDNWNVLLPFAKIVDVIIPFEGEIPLLKTINAFESNQSLNNVPGIINYDNGNLIYHEYNQEIYNCESYIPNFKDFSFSKYLSPYSIIPYSSSKGCYWGKCTFCSQHLLYKNSSYKKKNDEKIVDELFELSKQYGVNEFYFVDEAMPVTTVVYLAERLKKEGKKIGWFGDMRLEKGIDSKLIKKLDDGGCRMLIMGLESSVKRIINLMKKGTSPEVISNILKSCYHSNIKTFIMFFVGFPTESREEALETINFVEEHREYIYYISFDRFVLLKNTPVFLNPDNYLITIQEDKGNDDLAIHSKFYVSSGLSTLEAERLLNSIRKRPIISSYIEQNIISRSHLPYLPKNKVKTRKHENKEIPLDYCPHKLKHIKLLKLKYDITAKEINKIVDNSCFCYNPISQIMISAGVYGKALIELCDGNQSLSGILDFFGEINREEIMSFYNHLYNRGMI